MGAVKEMWIARQEEICDQYCAGDLTYPEAIDSLVRLGFDPHEAANLLEMSLA